MVTTNWYSAARTRDSSAWTDPASPPSGGGPRRVRTQETPSAQTSESGAFSCEINDAGSTSLEPYHSTSARAASATDMAT